MDPDRFSVEEEADYRLLLEVEQCVKTAQALPILPKEPLFELREKIDSHTFNLVVVGEFKRGKSSAINALIGANLLPIGVIPLTSIATVLFYGEHLAVDVVFENGVRSPIAPESLWGYVTEKGNPHNEKRVREVRIAYPSPWLKSGVQLVDTPGIGSVYRHNTDVAYHFLPKADAVLFLLSVDQPVGQTEFEFLKQVNEYAGKIFFLLNKTDLLDESDLQESVAFSSKVLAEAMGKPVPVFAVSARLALEGKAKHSSELLEKSRFPEFSAALSRFLMAEKGKTLVISVARNLLRTLTQTRFTAELALKSLSTPIEELCRKIEIFEAKRRQVDEVRNDFSVLLENESKRLAETIVTEDVALFRDRVATELEQNIRGKFEEIRALPSRELHDALERFIIDEVRNAYDDFREREDDKIEAAFEAACSRFTAKIDETVDELYRFSSELFAVSFDAVRAESIWSAQPGFYYKFWSEPPGLRILTSSAILALPKFIGDMLILKNAVKFGREMADTQAGRVRYDFARRLDKSMRKFKNIMLGRIDATLESIDAALRKGAEMDASGKKDIDTRAAELASNLEALGSLADRLQDIVQRAIHG